MTLKNLMQRTLARHVDYEIFILFNGKRYPISAFGINNSRGEIILNAAEDVKKKDSIPQELDNELFEFIKGLIKNNPNMLINCLNAYHVRNEGPVSHNNEIIQYLRDSNRIPYGVMYACKVSPDRFGIGVSTCNLNYDDFDQKEGLERAKQRAYQPTCKFNIRRSDTKKIIEFLHRSKKYFQDCESMSHYRFDEEEVIKTKK